MSLNLARGCTTIRVSVRILLLQLCLLSSAKGTWVYWTVTKVLTSIWNFKYCPIFRIRLNQTHLGQCCGSTYLLSSDAPKSVCHCRHARFCASMTTMTKTGNMSNFIYSIFALNEPYHNWIIKVFIRICDTMQFDAFLCFWTWLNLAQLTHLYDYFPTLAFLTAFWLFWIHRGLKSWETNTCKMFSRTEWVSLVTLA